MVTTPSTPRLSIGSRVCQCAACDEFFYSPYSFDAHRTLDAGAVDRRCMTKAEMREAGLGVNAHGFWSTEYKGAK